MEVRFIDVKTGKSHARRLPCVVGRGDEAGLRVRNDSVSRSHCTFTAHDGVVHVTDSGSTNGTFLGANRLAADVATAVPSGAQVRVGGIVLRVEYATATTRGVADADTVSVAATVPELEPAAASPAAPILEPPPEPLPELEPALESVEPLAAQAEVAAPVVPPDEPLLPTGAEPPPADIPAFAELEPAPPPVDGSFDFLGESAAPPPADDKLDDFFKSLS